MGFVKSYSSPTVHATTGEGCAWIFINTVLKLSVSYRTGTHASWELAPEATSVSICGLCLSHCKISLTGSDTTTRT
jgi:hypothetical protein